MAAFSAEKFLCSVWKLTRFNGSMIYGSLLSSNKDY